MIKSNKRQESCLLWTSNLCQILAGAC